MNLSLAHYPRYFFACLMLVAAAVWLAAVNGKPAAAPRFEVPEVGVAQAQAMIDAGALIIDVRGEAKSKYQHIPGALLIPLTVLRAGIPPALAAVKDKPILVYCGDGVTTGPQATRILREAGYSKVVNLKPGIEGWVDAKLPVQKG